MEEQEAVNRYLLNLKREIGLQIRSLKPTTLAEAQGYASKRCGLKNFNQQGSLHISQNL